MDSKKTPTTGQEVFRRCRPAAPARTKTPTTPAATTTTAATTTAGRSAKEPPAGVSRSSLGEEKWPRRRGRGEFNLKTAVGGEVLREDVVADAPDGFVKAHLLVRRTKPTSADAPAASARRPDSTAVFRFNISSLVLGVSLCAITVLLAIFARDIIFPPPIKPPPDQTIYLSNASNSRPSERSELGERNERSERNERDGDVERKFLPRNIIKLQPPKRKLSVKAPAHSDTSTSATSNGTAKTSLEIEQATPEQEPPATRRIRAFSGRVPALRIAVYHDISDRMQPYSESIRRYIYEQFPDADIFEFDGAFIHVRDNRVVGGANGKNKPTLGSAAKIIKETAEEKDEKRRKQLRELMGIKVAPTALPKMREEVRKYYVNHLTVEQHAYYEANLRQGEQGDVFLHLSDQGREIYRRYAQNFRDGSLGAWTDIMMYENYDALIIFSDFHPRIQNEKTSLAETPPPAESAPAGEKVPSGEKVPHGEKALIGEKVPSGEKVSHGEKTQIGEKVPLPAKAPVAETPPHSEKVSVGKKALIAEEAPLPAKAPVGETPPHGEKALIAEETPLPAKAPVAETPPHSEKALVGEKVSVGEEALVGEKVPLPAKAPVGEGAPHGEKALVGEKVSVGEEALVGEKVQLPAKAPVGEGAPHGEKALVGEKVSVGEEALFPAKAPVGETPPHSEKALVGEKVSVGAEALFPEREVSWEVRWEQHFAQARRRSPAGRSVAPKLYLISIEVPPQAIWLRCARASSGEIQLRPQLRR